MSIGCVRPTVEFPGAAMPKARETPFSEPYIHPINRTSSLGGKRRGDITLALVNRQTLVAISESTSSPFSIVFKTQVSIILTLYLMLERIKTGKLE